MRYKDTEAVFCDPFIAINGNVVGVSRKSDAYPDAIDEMVRRYNNFDEALTICDELLDKAMDLARMAETSFAEDFADYRVRLLQLETVEC